MIEKYNLFHLITGHKIGITYEFKRGGGFVVGLDDLSGHDVAYVYPDMKTIIVGRFKKGQLVSGMEAELNGLTYADNGLLRPIYKTKDKKLFTYSVSNQTWIGSDPLIRDPLDDKYLSVGESSVSGAGRGIFLKTKARKGFTVGFYNGVRLTDIESKVSKCLSIFLYVHILDFFSVSFQKYSYRLTLTLIGMSYGSKKNAHL